MLTSVVAAQKCPLCLAPSGESNKIIAEAALKPNNWNPEWLKGRFPNEVILILSNRSPKALSLSLAVLNY